MPSQTIPIRHVNRRLDRRWRAIERIGLASLLIGGAGLATLHAPSILARYVTNSELPVVNTPFHFGDEVGVTEQEYVDELAHAPYVLEVPGHGIRANIVPEVSTQNEKEYWKALTKGVALADSSAALDSVAGNSFIFGHSGRVTLKPSPYDTIFAALPDVKNGEDITVKIRGVPSTFIVTQSRSVAADDFSVLENVEGKKTLTLMTCWPLNTWYKRWIVRAEQMDSTATELSAE